MRAVTLGAALARIACFGLAAAGCLGASSEGEFEWVNRQPAGCHAAIDKDAYENPVAVDPLASGQPLFNLVRRGGSASEAEADLIRLGVCYSFRYEYTYLDEPTTGYSEIWCTAPVGDVDDVLYTSRGSIVLFVRGEPQDGARPQPSRGWGC